MISGQCQWERGSLISVALTDMGLLALANVCVLAEHTWQIGRGAFATLEIGWGCAPRATAMGEHTQQIGRGTSVTLEIGWGCASRAPIHKLHPLGERHGAALVPSFHNKFIL